MKQVLFGTLLLFLITSCSQKKNISYFQDIDQITNDQLKELAITYKTVIRPDDELSITVSSIDPNAVTAFNLPVYKSKSSTMITDRGVQSAISPDLGVQTYIVNPEGYIHFPTLGKIKLGGMTKDEAIQYIETQLKDYVKEPIVNIQILNFKVSVIGEVLNPGTYYFTGQRVSVLDALAAAKDMTIYGNRQNLLLIRDNNGAKEYIRLNLTKKDMLTSSAFYLQQNDVLYIEPTEQRQKDSDIGIEKQYNTSIITSTLGLTLSAISTTFTVLFTLHQMNN